MKKYSTRYKWKQSSLQPVGNDEIFDHLFLIPKRKMGGLRFNLFKKTKKYFHETYIYHPPGKDRLPVTAGTAEKHT